MSRTVNGVSQFSPLYLHTFHLLVPRKLLDNYHLFLYCGQAQQSRAHREKLGLNVLQFALHCKIHPENVYAWESGAKVISRRMWEVCFRGNIG